jgi:transcriptional regulator with XRE-family HTH domain
MAGRPTDYKPEYNKQAYRLCLLGATNADLAEALEVSISTIEDWLRDKPSFSRSVKRGKKHADARVAKSLYHRAIGYSHQEDKIFNNNGQAMIVPTIKHYAPDPTAGIFWLKNRDPKNWREKQDVDLRTPDGIQLAAIDATRLAGLTDEQIAETRETMRRALEIAQQLQIESK